MSPTDARTDSRLAALNAWTDTIERVAGSVPVPASVDASFRRYFRLRKGSESFIVMDAPPEQEDCVPFVRIAGFFEAMQLSGPRIIEADIENGFLLISDLGSEQYLDALRRSPGRGPQLYDDAITALIAMQQRGAAYQSTLPSYNESLLRTELALFWEWLCDKHVQLPLSNSDKTDWAACCDILVDNALCQPQVFVHRDFHSRNLMVMENDNPGILDFQDAVEGPLTYDLVSLLKDCYVRWPAEQVREWALQYYANLDLSMRTQVDELQFRRYFDLMGVQRHLKAAGIFCRLYHRDGKSGYLGDVALTLNYIAELGAEYAELEFLFRFVRERVLPAWNTVK